MIPRSNPGRICSQVIAWNQAPWWKTGEFKIKGAKKKWRVNLLERREKAVSGAKPGDMLFMPQIGFFDVFANFQSFFQSENLGSHIVMSTDDRFLPQGSVTHTLARTAEMHLQYLAVLIE